jgi:hypothetical protein
MPRFLRMSSARHDARHWRLAFRSGGRRTRQDKRGGTVRDRRGGRGSDRAILGEGRLQRRDFVGAALAGGSSVSTTVSPARLTTVTGTISEAKAPDEIASCARRSDSIE